MSTQTQSTDEIIRLTFELASARADVDLLSKKLAVAQDALKSVRVLVLQHIDRTCTGHELLAGLDSALKELP